MAVVSRTGGNRELHAAAAKLQFARRKAAGPNLRRQAAAAHVDVARAEESGCPLGRKLIAAAAHYIERLLPGGLGPQYTAIPLSLDPANPLPFAQRHSNQSLAQQQHEYESIGRLNALAAVEYPEDQELRARIRSYELAFRLQAAAPDAVDLGQETEATLKLYGLDNDATKVAGQQLLAARRLVERGVRFVQVFPSAYGAWDSHQHLKDNHTRLCATVDLPVAGLVQDLKQRDHHPNGFTIWMAGAGLKRGHVHGATDELGYHALGAGRWAMGITWPTSTPPFSNCSAWITGG